jgi:ribosome-associated protein
LAGRVNEAGELVIRVQDSRSQAHNRVLARERAMALLVQALHREKPRRATKPTRASRERRLEAKRQTAGRKAGRRPHADD